MLLLVQSGYLTAISPSGSDCCVHAKAEARSHGIISLLGLDSAMVVAGQAGGAGPGILLGVTDIDLKRTPDDRRLYALEGVGTLRLEGLGSRTAIAQAGEDSWRLARRRFWQRAIEATDAAGTVVGEFKTRGLRRGGTLRWAGRELTLGPASRWRERYALADGDRELAILDGKGWGRRPVKVSADDPGAIEPGLLLFAAFVVRRLAEGAGASAGAAASGG